jgi:hypothetical protein
MPVRSSGEPGQDVLRRVESGGWLERAGQGPGVCDAIEPERPVLADAGIRARHVPAAGVGDEPVGVQGAFRDGNLVNFFTPVTPAAIEKFAR